MNRLHACTIIIVHACTTIIVHARSLIIVLACTMTTVHACTMVLVHTCSMIIVHACTMIIVHACIMIIEHACTMSIVCVSCPTELMQLRSGVRGATIQRGLGGRQALNVQHSQSLPPSPPPLRLVPYKNVTYDTREGH